MLAPNITLPHCYYASNIVAGLLSSEFWNTTMQRFAGKVLATVQPGSCLCTQRTVAGNAHAM